VTLKTNRINLLPHSQDNLLKMTQWMNDPELLYFDDNEPEPYKMKSEDEMKAIMDRLVASTPESGKDIIHFAIHKNPDDNLIGYCMIAFIDHYNKSCQFGVTIGEKAEWNKDLGSEVLHIIKDYCFTELGMNRIGAEIYAHNPGSIRMFEKAGFIREGVVRQAVVKNGRFVDAYIYGLLKEDWVKADLNK
jgi:RimJ/RimL family protein N-acetyltransferase